MHNGQEGSGSRVVGVTGTRRPFPLEPGLIPSPVNFAVSVLAPSSWEIPGPKFEFTSQVHIGGHCFLLLYLGTVKWFCSSESNSTTVLNFNFLKAIRVVLKS